MIIKKLMVILYCSGLISPALYADDNLANHSASKHPLNLFGRVSPKSDPPLKRHKPEVSTPSPSNQSAYFHGLMLSEDGASYVWINQQLLEPQQQHGQFTLIAYDKNSQDIQITYQAHDGEKKILTIHWMSSVPLHHPSSHASYALQIQHREH